ncbi:MAG: RNA-guided endonuclease InsQ/TnpB family protein [Acidimicrobiales bacterium]
MARKRNGLGRRDPHDQRGRRGTKLRVYPDEEVRQRGRQIAGCCRLVKNLAKEQRDTAWGIFKERVGYVEQTSFLKELRDTEAYAYLKTAPSQVLQQALRDTDDAYRRFMKGESGYPTWTKRSGGYRFRDPQGVKLRRTSKRWGEVKLQGMGWVKVRLHRSLVGTRICSATYEEEPDGTVWVTLLTEVHERRPTKPKVASFDSAVGIDVGVAVPVALSDGKTFDQDFWKPGELRRKVRLERRRERQKAVRTREGKKLSPEERARRRKTSKRQDETNRQIAALHSRARRRRQDFCEQVSTTLARNHRLVGFEDLTVRAMTASAKGTVEEPGTNVAQKVGLDRGILDKGWGAMRTRTEHKAKRHGHLVQRVPAPWTSLTCPECSSRDRKNRPRRALFSCANCGYAGHADVVGAINIKRRALELVLAGGTPVTASPGTNRDSSSEEAEPSGLPWLGSANKSRVRITVGSKG